MSWMTDLNLSYNNNKGSIMLITKVEMLKSIDVELEERESTGYDCKDEIRNLKELRSEVESECNLSFQDYEWLCYMVFNNLKEEE